MSATVENRPPNRHRPWLFAFILVTLAALSASGTIGLLGSGTRVAVGGQLPVHRSADTAPGSYAPDAPFPGAPETVFVPVGPHLDVPILYYHYIRSVIPKPQNVLGFDLSISPAMFAEQMALLYVEGAHTVTLATLVAALEGRARLPSHPLVLTFDDGYADFATAAYPVLARYGFVATDFVVSGFIGHRGYMTAAQVLAMDAAGMVIGCHTVHHVDLAHLPAVQARAEIDASQAALQRLLGHPVLDFAYPYGGFDATVVQLVEQAGFRDAVSTLPGDGQTVGSLFTLRRTELGGAPSLDLFAGDAGLRPPSTAESTLIAALAALSPSATTA